jgi:hypothetical protein
MGRFQNNPSIGCVHPKSTHAHPLAWGNKKKQGTLSACLGLHIGCTKFLFPKEFVTIFGVASMKFNINFDVWMQPHWMK